MIKHRAVFAACAAAFLAVTAAAAGDPTGTWKWTRTGRDGQTVEVTMKLAFNDGKVTGTVTGFRGQENPISDAKLEEDHLTFKVQVDFGGGSFSIDYDGMLKDDAIDGTITFPGRDGGPPRTMEWHAKREDS
jgi:hypothetical protein